MLGKTTGDRRRYFSVKEIARMEARRYKDFSAMEVSSLGELVEVPAARTNIKNELREISERQHYKHGGTSEGPDWERMRVLLCEADARGWSNTDLARVMRCSVETARNRRIRALCARDAMEEAA